MTEVEDRRAIRSCHWCHVAIRRATVLVGPDPGRPVELWIDLEPVDDPLDVDDPHEGGSVIKLDDGTFRRILEDTLEYRRGLPGHRTGPYGRDRGLRLYRIHGNRTCGYKKGSRR